MRRLESSVGDEEYAWENQPCSIVDKGIFKEGRKHKEHTNSGPNVDSLNSKGFSKLVLSEHNGWLLQFEITKN